MTNLSVDRAGPRGRRIVLSILTGLPAFGLQVVGGLLMSQVLTLYITPVYYVYIERARIWLASRRRKLATEVPHPEAAPATALHSIDSRRGA